MRTLKNSTSFRLRLLAALAAASSRARSHARYEGRFNPATLRVMGAMPATLMVVTISPSLGFLYGAGSVTFAQPCT